MTDAERIHNMLRYLVMERLVEKRRKPSAAGLSMKEWDQALDDWREMLREDLEEIEENHRPHLP